TLVTNEGGANKSVSGKLGTAVTFDGFDDVVTFGSPAGLPMGASDYTIEAWIKPDSVGTTRGIIGFGDYGTTDRVNALRLASSAACPATGVGLTSSWQGDDLTICTR